MSNRGATKLTRRDVLIIGAGTFIVGIVCVCFGMVDYSDHTERAEATVSEQEFAQYDDGSESVTSYVDYTAGGTDHTSVELEGTRTDDLEEGQNVTVAYAPDDSEHVVAPVDTESLPYAPLIFVGAAVMVFAVYVVYANWSRVGQTSA